MNDLLYPLSKGPDSDGLIHPEWHPFQWFLFRGTGMPFEWLEGLGAKPIWEIGKEESYQKALSDTRRGLWEVSQHPMYREALFLLNPDFERRSARWRASFFSTRRNTKARNREYCLMRYLQRFCAKNDSNSFFGGVAAGRFDQSVSEMGPLPIMASRRVFITQWVVQEILNAAIRELKAAGIWVERPQRAPAVRLGPPVTRYIVPQKGFEFDIKGSVTDERAKQVVELADGEKTMDEIRAKSIEKTGMSEKDFEILIQSLFSGNILQHVDSLPSGLIEPLKEAIKRLERQPEHPIRDLWLERIAWLMEEIQRFQVSDLRNRRPIFYHMEEAIEIWTCKRPRRYPGEFYASRTTLQEMADRTGEVMGLPEGWREKIVKDLGSYMDLCLMDKIKDRMIFRDWFTKRYDTLLGHQFYWTDLFSQWAQDLVEGNISLSEDALRLSCVTNYLKTHMQDILSQHMQDRGIEEPLVIDPMDFLKKNDSRSDFPDSQGTPYVNPDIMISVQDGDIIPILADAHHLPFLTGNLLVSLQAESAIVKDTQRFLAGICHPALPAIIWSHQYSFINVMPDFKTIAIEVSGIAPFPPERRTSIMELRVLLSESGFRFKSPNYLVQEMEIVPLTRFMKLDLASPVFPVTLPSYSALIGESHWKPPPFMPRVLCGDLIVQRRSWRVPSYEWADARTMLACAKHLRQYCGDAFPRFTFMTARSEHKPVLVDWANPICVEMARRLARREMELTFVEMLPEPSELWLHSQEGRHTCELRTVFIKTKSKSGVRS